MLADRLQKGLVKRGYEVALFNSHKDKSEQVMQFSPRIVHSFNAERTFPWMKLFRSSFTARWVITLTGTDYAPWCGIKDPPAHIKENLEHADALIVFHEPAAISLSASLPMLKNKIHIIPQGIAPLESTEDRSTDSNKVRNRTRGNSFFNGRRDSASKKSFFGNQGLLRSQKAGTGGDPPPCRPGHG